MLEFIWSKFPDDYSVVSSAVTLVKCSEKMLWHDSKYVAKQFDGIGPKYAESLVASGKISFQAIKDSNPRDLERVS
jgi:predicted flap endonuclease-1-like 5' DNA nuclease